MPFLTKSKSLIRKLFSSIIEEIKTVVLGLGLTFWELIKRFYHYSGLAHVWRKFTVVEDDKKYPSGPLWIITIYFAIYGLANQPYERDIDRLQRKVDLIRSGVATDNDDIKKYWLAQIPITQSQKIHIKPLFFHPTKTIPSFFDIKTSLLGEEDGQNINQDLISIIESLKINLTGVNLPKANLEGADLMGANLERANLGGANLKKAILIEANLEGAYLYNAKLQGAKLEKANLKGAKLREAKLQAANLRKANLFEVSLYRANLFKAQLSGADLQGADLFEVKLQKAILIGAQLQGANLHGAQLREANFLEAQLQGANLLEANLQGAILFEAQLQGANLHKAQLQGTALIEARLKGAENLICEQIKSAIIDKTTHFPDYLRITWTSDDTYKCEEIKKEEKKK